MKSLLLFALLISFGNQKCIDRDQFIERSKEFVGIRTLQKFIDRISKAERRKRYKFRESNLSLNIFFQPFTDRSDYKKEFIKEEQFTEALYNEKLNGIVKFYGCGTKTEGDKVQYLFLYEDLSLRLFENIGLVAGKSVSKKSALLFYIDLLKIYEDLHARGYLHNGVSFKHIYFKRNVPNSIEPIIAFFKNGYKKGAKNLVQHPGHLVKWPQIGDSSASNEFARAQLGEMFNVYAIIVIAQYLRTRSNDIQNDMVKIQDLIEKSQLKLENFIPNKKSGSRSSNRSTSSHSITLDDILRNIYDEFTHNGSLVKLKTLKSDLEGLFREISNSNGSNRSNTSTRGSKNSITRKNSNNILSQNLGKSNSNSSLEDNLSMINPSKNEQSNKMRNSVQGSNSPQNHPTNISTSSGRDHNQTSKDTLHQSKEGGSNCTSLGCKKSDQNLSNRCRTSQTSYGSSRASSDKFSSSSKSLDSLNAIEHLFYPNQSKSNSRNSVGHNLSFRDSYKPSSYYSNIPSDYNSESYRSLSEDPHAFINTTARMLRTKNANFSKSNYESSITKIRTDKVFSKANSRLI